ncbi:hypothetical protein GCM10027155_12980 [Acinetobacter apis]|uniref:Uncharacterized protein n=1 Tax=Acinetobacter apis TaxID=1229165 RepID=A0A217EIL2_9GAMM|nr:hypothetical protein [Acinetobacter apis]SNQ30086.1 hypothetical protein SAMN05444584_2070 [Acinetobacter apis]
MFKPFQGDESSAIYDLTLENGLDRINIYGNLQITKDQDGLKTAKALHDFLTQLTTELENTDSLPDKIQIQDQKEVENPFL